MKKLTKKTMIKLSVLTVLILSSGLGVFTYAESVKESQVKEQLMSEQVMLEASLQELYKGDFYQLASINQLKKTLASYSVKLEGIKGKTKSLTTENAQEVNKNNKDLANEMSDVYDLVKIYEAQNSLFEEAILTESGIDKEVKLKEGVTLEKIKQVSEEIKANSQSADLEEETTAILAFAEIQLTTKQAVEDWLTKNEKKYSKKNYEALQKLVDQVVPSSTKTAYQGVIDTFKKGLDKKVAEEKAAKEKAEKEAQKQANTFTQVANATTTQSGQSSTAGSQSTQGQSAPTAPAPRTDGFNFHGYHFDLSSFSGLGAVPQWTPYIYQWTDDPSHYLVEKASSAGSAIWNIGVGDTVVINGQTYTVFNVIRHVPNDENAYGVLKSQGATVTWQTCETSSADSDLAIWYAY